MTCTQEGRHTLNDAGRKTTQSDLVYVHSFVDKSSSVVHCLRVGNRKGVRVLAAALYNMIRDLPAGRSPNGSSNSSQSLQHKQSNVACNRLAHMLHVNNDTT